MTHDVETHEYNPLNFCTVDELNGKDNYSVDPGVMFPVTIARILEVINNDPPVELLPPGTEGNIWYDPIVMNFLGKLNAIPREVWVRALKPYNPEHPDELRTLALDEADSYFKRAMRAALGDGVHFYLHYIRNLDWKR